VAAWFLSLAYTGMLLQEVQTLKSKEKVLYQRLQAAEKSRRELQRTVDAARGSSGASGSSSSSSSSRTL
jgi:hypothetical protein